MKANEAPEKIYVSNYCSGLTYNWHSERLAINDIEYTRTDAFIEKVCEWIKMTWSETDDRFKEDYTGILIKNFKNYIKGE